LCLVLEGIGLFCGWRVAELPKGYRDEPCRISDFTSSDPKGKPTKAAKSFEDFSANATPFLKG
jgi:hypothetical protein